MKDVKEYPWLRAMIADILVELADQVPETLVELIQLCAKRIYREEPFSHFINHDDIVSD